MRLFMVGLTLLVPTVVRASDQDVAAIKTRIELARSSEPGAIRPASIAESYGSVALVIFSVQDSRSFSPPARRKIITAAVSGLGDVVGYVLKKNGRSVCSFYGITDGTCLVLQGCVSGTVCN
jgi:hypothetical protein